MAQILIVDDDRDCIEFLTIYLKARGHSVRAAQDGAGALESVAMAAPDLMLADLRLPGMDGARLVEILRTSPAAARMPVVFISAADSRWAASRLPDDPLTRYVEKPLDFATLDAALAALLTPA